MRIRILTIMLLTSIIAGGFLPSGVYAEDEKDNIPEKVCRNLSRVNKYEI